MVAGGGALGDLVGKVYAAGLRGRTRQSEVTTRVGFVTLTLRCRPDSWKAGEGRGGSGGSFPAPWWERE